MQGLNLTEAFWVATNQQNIPFVQLLICFRRQQLSPTSNYCDNHSTYK
jgi:hypothetical protein